MNSNFLKRPWRRIRRGARMLRWGSAALIDAGKPYGARRMLIIYDFSSQPFSIGDVLIFQEASLVLRERYGAEKVDFSLVYEPASPVVPDPAFRQVDAEGFLVHLSSILPAAQVNPYLGSLMLFDSHRRIERYVTDNAEDYIVWPELAQYASRDYLYYYCFNDLFRQHFEEHGRLPVLASRPLMSAWAKRFFAEHCRTAVPVTVQLRQNLVNSGRNSNIDVWIEFFRDCLHKFDAKFLVICGRNEVDDRLRRCPNVVIAKDHGTGIEQDLALIEAATLHMGMASGPGTMAQFGRKPYCMFKWDHKLGSIAGILKDDYRYRYQFSTPFQNWIFESETVSLLKIEFQRIWDGREVIFP